MKYTHAVKIVGLKQWQGESFYDSYTGQPHVCAIATSKAKAEEWIKSEESRQAHRITILPGQGQHNIYAVASLDDATTYMPRQDAERFSPNLGQRKKLLIASDVIKIG